MNKRILALILAFATLFVMGCNGADANGGNENGSDNRGSAEEKDESGNFVFKGVIKSLDNDRHIEMEIIDSEIAFGIYWVIVSDQTKFTDKNGSAINRTNLKVGDTIAVTFSGQVMMSYPPQISAQKITLL